MAQAPAEQRMKEYARAWRSTGALLEQIRDRETCLADTPAFLYMMETAYRIALRDLPPRATSGLVEWQRRTAAWRSRG